MKDERNNRCAKPFNKLKHPLQLNMFWFFSDDQNFCQDQIVNSQSNYWFARNPQDVPTVMKTKHPVHIMVFGVATHDSDVIPPFVFLHGFRHNTEALICTWTRLCCSGSRGWLLEDPMSGNRTLCHIAQAVEPNLGCRKISVTSPLTSVCLTFQIAIPLITMCGVWGVVVWKTNKTACNTKDENDVSSMCGPKL